VDKSEDVVRHLLDFLEPRIDLEHVAAVAARHHKALNYEKIDRLPLVCYLPYEGQDFEPYSFAEIFVDPAKMMVNELLVGFTSIFHAVDLKDDSPYCLRPNLGVTMVASMLGADIRIMEDQPPWVIPIEDINELREIVDAPLPDRSAGLVPRALEQYDYYRETLRDYPRCQAAFQLTLPDLQGPFDILELLWGPDAFMAFYDDPELLTALLQKITDTILLAHDCFGGQVKENIGDGFQYQHATAVKGEILLRSDTTIMISPSLYQEFILPHDSRIGQALGSVAVHFCGNGQHQLANMLETTNLGSLDFGQSWMMDVDDMYAAASAQKAGLTRVTVPNEQLTARQASDRFPTGVNLVYYPKDLADAQQTWQSYAGNAPNG
jgi:hypothetical protein